MGQDQFLYTIQKISSKLEIPKPTLRFWEKKLDGLLKPLRTEGGQRRYTYKHISIIEEVKRLREKGIALAEVKRILHSKTETNKKKVNDIEFLAHRLGTVVREEIYKFYNQQNDEAQ